MDGMHVIGRGRVLRLVEDALLDVRVVGEAVGERALLRDAPAPWTCLVADWCELHFLRGADFRALCVDHPVLMRRLVTYDEEVSQLVRAAERGDQSSIQVEPSLSRRKLNTRESTVVKQTQQLHSTEHPTQTVPGDPLLTAHSEANGRRLKRASTEVPSAPFFNSAFHVSFVTNKDGHKENKDGAKSKDGGGSLKDLVGSKRAEPGPLEV